MRLQPYTYQQLHVIWQDEGSTLNPGLGSLITTAGLNQISKLKTSDPDEIVKNPEIADKDIHYFMRETFSKLILRQQSSWYDPFQL
jgi:hypothetical protein